MKAERFLLAHASLGMKRLAMSERGTCGNQAALHVETAGRER